MSTVGSDVLGRPARTGEWKLASVYANPAWFERADRARFVLRAALAAAGMGLALTLLAGMGQERRNLLPCLAGSAAGLRAFHEGKPFRLVWGQTLRAGDALATGAAASAPLTFGDGAALKLGPWTQVAIRALDSGPQGRYDRSFLLEGGAVFLRLGRRAAPNRTLICTPGAVVSGEPGGFRVAYDPGTGRTAVEVAAGAAILRSAGGSVVVLAGRCAVAQGDDPPALEALSAGTRGGLERTRSGLVRYETIPNGFQRMALRLWGMLSPVARRVGVTAAGFDLQGSDPARRTQALLALKRIGQEIAAQSGEAPERVNPVTLAEFGLPASLRDSLLPAFSGMVIDRYERSASGFLLEVHGRDSQRTAYRLTESGVAEIRPSRPARHL